MGDQEIAVMVYVDGRIATIQVDFVLTDETNINWPELLLLNFLPSTHTITVISWVPPLISQLFHTGHFKQGLTFFYSQAVFE